VLPFVGRRAELEALRRYNARQMPMPIFVYGPEGCGKSCLFREAVRRFKEWYQDGEALLIDATMDDVDKTFAASPLDTWREVVEELRDRLATSYLNTTVLPGLHGLYAPPLLRGVGMTYLQYRAFVTYGMTSANATAAANITTPVKPKLSKPLRL